MAYYDAELAKDPANAAHQRNASLMRKYLSSTLMELGRREQAEPHFRRALELDELRLAVAPEDRQTRLDAAISSGQMGEFFERTGNRAEAAELYARSVVLRRQAVESDPKDVMARERLSHGLMTLGRVRGRLGNAAEARVLLHEAIAVEEEVIKVTRDLSSRAQLAHLWSEIAAVEEGAGQTPAACRAYRRAQEQFIAAQAALTDANKVRLATVRSKISECSALND